MAVGRGKGGGNNSATNNGLNDSIQIVEHTMSEWFSTRKLPPTPDPSPPLASDLPPKE